MRAQSGHQRIEHEDTKTILKSEPNQQSAINILSINNPYSYLSATIGSTFVARLAGTQHASKATNASSNAIPTNVHGFVALTPKSRFFIVRVNANEETIPNATPTNASFIPFPITIRKTFPLCAPSVIPQAYLSGSLCHGVRHTAVIPMLDNANATIAKTVSNIIENRLGATD